MTEILREKTGSAQPLTYVSIRAYMHIDFCLIRGTYNKEWIQIPTFLPKVEFEPEAKHASAQENLALSLSQSMPGSTVSFLPLS